MLNFEAVSQFSIYWSGYVYLVCNLIKKIICTTRGILVIGIGKGLERKKRISVSYNGLRR